MEKDKTIRKRSVGILGEVSALAEKQMLSKCGLTKEAIVEVVERLTSRKDQAIALKAFGVFLDEGSAAVMPYIEQQIDQEKPETDCSA